MAVTVLSSAAEKAAESSQSVRPFRRKRPSREPFPDHLPRERIVIPAPPSLHALAASLVDDETNTVLLPKLPGARSRSAKVAAE